MGVDNGIEITEIKAAARGRWPEIISQLGSVELTSLTGQHGPCPKCGGTDRFRVFEDFAESGGMICNQCFSKRNGDGVAALMWLQGWSFQETVSRLADFLAIENKKTRSAAASKFEIGLSQLQELAYQHESLLESWSESKPPITIEAIKATGGKLYRWPKNSRSPFVVLAFEAYSQPGKRNGVILYRTDGKDFPEIGKLPSRKTHMIRGSREGWVIPGGFDAIAAADNIIKVEGIPDALSVYPQLPDGYAVITNICGAKSKKFAKTIFKGKNVIILGDADQTGQQGTRIFADEIGSTAASVKIAELPFEVTNRHGKDLRDFVAEGGHVSALLERAKDCTPRAANARSIQTKDSPGDPVETFDPEDRTDRRNAELLIELHGKDICYCPQWKTWLVWDGKRWKRDDAGQIICKAHAVSQYWFSLWHDVDDEDEKQACLRHAIRSANTTPILNFLRQAQSLVAVDVSQLNQNCWLLNVANGTIDLRTGEIRPHRREDLLTILCQTRFNPNAGSQYWDQFLDSLYPDDQEMIDFLQRLFGSALAGEQLDHILPILHGCGANGKSVMMNAFLETLGDDYAMSAPPNLLIDTGQERHLTELADLYGKRFVVTSETGEGRRLKEDLIKRLTGNDKVRARHLYEKHFEFRPEFLVVMVTNHRPRILGTDEGVWRRVKMVPFERSFRDKDADPHLGTKLTKEYEGVLKWLIQGCLAWQQRGLDAPKAVEVASSEYRSENDVMGQFIESECYVNPGIKTRFSDLYEAFVKWCDENGENAMNRKKAGQLLQERFEKFKNSGIWY